MKVNKSAADKTLKYQFSTEVLKVSALLVYALISLLVIFCHEPWRDEADAWLVVRDMGFFEIFNHLRYTGHPSLWYLLIMPLAKAGLPYISMNILHWLIALIMAGVFLWRAPFPLILRIMAVFTAWMFYEFVVIARNYNISVLLLFLIATLYTRRLEKPLLYAGLIFLLYHTNVMVLFASGLLSLFFIIDVLKKNKKEKKAKKPEIIAVGIVMLGLITAILQYFPPSDIQLGLERPMPYFYWWNVGRSLTSAFLMGERVGNQYPVLLVMAVLFISAAIYVFLLGGIMPLLFLGGNWLWITYIFCCRYNCDLRHHIFYIIFLLFSLWITRKIFPETSKKLANPQLAYYSGAICFAILYINMILGMVQAAGYIKRDIEKPFSAGKEMARFLKETGYDQEIIIAHSPLFTESVLPYLPRTQLWYPYPKRFGTYIKWNYAEVNSGLRKKNQDVMELADSNYPDHFARRPRFFLFHEPLRNAGDYDLILLKSALGARENFHLYVKKVNKTK